MNKKVTKTKKETKVNKEPELTKARYQVSISFNNETHEFETNDLEEVLLSVKPVFLKTKIVLVIKDGEKVCEKLAYGHQARQLFRNTLFRKVFLSKLVFK